MRPARTSHERHAVFWVKQAATEGGLNRQARSAEGDKGKSKRSGRLRRRALQRTSDTKWIKSRQGLPALQASKN